MNDKQLILDSLNYFKNNNGHTDLKEYWNGLSLSTETQTRIKIKLEENNLATPYIYDAWKMMITTAGLKVKPNDLNDEGNLKKKRLDKEFRRGVTTTLIGVFVGFALTFLLEFTKAKWLTESKETIVLPKIQLVRDTIEVPVQQIKGEKKNVLPKK